MIQAVIIDSDENTRVILINNLKNYCPEIIVVAQAKNLETGLIAVKKCNPDIVFSDIIFPDGSSFDLLQKLNEINFKIIFVTSHKQYAIEAFKHNAFGYLLNPIDPEELIVLIEKFKSVTKMRA